MSDSPRTPFAPRGSGIPGNRLGKGRNGALTITERGYIRIWHGSRRGQYAHRARMAESCAEFCYYPLSSKSGLPVGFTVEHVDHVRTHNCISNLLLLEECIHNACSWRSWTNDRSAYYNKPDISEVPF